MSKTQKIIIANWMLNFVIITNGTTSKNLISQAVIHCPFANRHHASGTLSSLVRKKLLLYYNNGWVS